MSTVVQKALTSARARLVILREFAKRTKEVGTVTLRAQEIWEVADQIAIDEIDQAIAELTGQVPLFDPKETAHV